MRAPHFIALLLMGPIALVVCTTLAACTSEAQLQRFTFSQVVMGVRADIAVYSVDSSTAADAARQAFAAMAALDDSLSDYRIGNEMARVNRSAGSGSVAVTPNFGIVLNKALEIGSATKGAFDPTVGPLVQLWRTARKGRILPKSDELEHARALTGLSLVTLSRGADGAFELSLAKPGMRLDFGGIGKGFAADSGLAALRRAGCSRAMVSVAGDIAAGDRPPHTNGWRISLMAGPDETTYDMISIENSGISTSGDTEQYTDIDGVRYSHIVDPRTGMGLVGAPIVTVVAPDATTSDALATALCVLGTASIPETIQRFPGAACLVRDESPPFHVLFKSPQFSDRLTERKP